MFDYSFKAGVRFFVSVAVLLIFPSSSFALSNEDKKSLELTNADKEAIPFRLESARALFLKALRYQSKKKWNEAVDYYKKCIAQNSSIPEAFHNLGLCYEELHKLPEALESFKKAACLEGGFRSTYKHIARIYLEMGDQQQAESWLKKYLAS